LVGSAKDLKPESLIEVRRTNLPVLLTLDGWADDTCASVSALRQAVALKNRSGTRMST